MNKYTITIGQTVFQYYTVELEASSAEEAEQLGQQFENARRMAPNDDGLDIEWETTALDGMDVSSVYLEPERTGHSDVIGELARHATLNMDHHEFHNSMECDWNGGEYDEKELEREFYQCELERLADLTDEELKIENAEYELNEDEAQAA